MLSALAAFRDRCHVPGVVVTMFDLAGPGETYALGTPSADQPGATLHAGTVAPIYSLAKMITGALVAGLAQTGEVDLDAPVTAWVPELRLRDADPDAVTLNHLLGHVSGLAPDRMGGAGSRNQSDLASEVLAAAARMPLIDRPGRTYAYSNIGISLAGLVAQRAGGAAFGDLVAERVTEPLGMTRTTYDPAVAMTYPLMQHHDRTGAVLHNPKAAVRYQPSGLCWSTTADLARLGAAHLREDALAVTHRRIGDVPAAATLATGAGTMLARRGGQLAVTHEGFQDGMWCTLVALPEARAGLAWIDNRGPELRTARWAVIEEILALHPGDPRSGAFVPSDAVTGRYTRFGAPAVTVSANGNTVTASAAGRREQLRRTAGDTWSSPKPVQKPGEPPWAPHMTTVNHALGAHTDRTGAVRSIHLNGLPYRKEPS